MRLKQLEVHGFKTFANRTTFLFNEGITAIVGPNGCGKSNIADGIRWALGEQSPSALRTKKTEDLIFTGSATRPRMGMAEVALTLENPFAFGNDERRITNDGVAEPSSNGDEQRPRANIVEEILHARPSEVTILRRAYRSGENEYLINRQRVRLRDILELLQRWGLARLTYAVIGQGLIDQALSLRAEERRALFEEAAGIGLYQTKKQNALEKLEETQQNLIRVNDIINEIAPRLPSLARQADRASKYESVATALNDKLRQWYAFQWSQAQDGLRTTQAQETAARERLSAQRASMHELAVQLTEARRTAQILRARLAEHRRVRQERETEFASRQRELAVLEERVRFSEQQLADAQHDADTASAALLEAQSVLEAQRTRSIAESEHAPSPSAESPDELASEELASPATQARSGDEQIAALASISERARRTEAEHQTAVENIATSLRDAEAEYQRALEQFAQAERAAESQYGAEQTQIADKLKLDEADQLENAERAYDELSQVRAAQEHQRARAIARKRLAEARLAEHDAQVQQRATGATTAPRDLAASLMELQEQLPYYESALPAIAGLAAHADALARQETMQREQARRLEQAREELNQARTALTLAERDVETARQAHINAQREHERAAREREREREHARVERQRTFEARAREREKRRAEREKDYERTRRELERTRGESERAIEQRRAGFQRERERLHAEHARLLREQEQLRAERIRQREWERERVRQERVRELERAEQDYARAERERETKTERALKIASQVEQTRAQRNSLQLHVQEQRAALQALTEQSLPDEAALTESERLQNELEEREAQLRSSLTQAEELYNRAVLDAERRRAEIARLEGEIEDDLGPVELDSDTPRQLRLRLVVRANRSPTLSEETESAPDAQPQELVTLPDVPSLPDGFDKEIRRLKNQMRYIGNVNPNAPQEYAELKERHAFLTEQAADLQHAIERLHQAINELDEMMKTRFKETFDAINGEFKKYFAILFGGGTARLELTEPDDLIHSGIEITARPPGKRAAQLVLLSGGERALTAAALLFAILKVSPTPFCVLDEVDAALDEANVGRFRDVLKELAQETQFIVITHNRVTMEGASAIYGVSMGEDGISQVLSLRLEELPSTVVQ